MGTQAPLTSFLAGVSCQNSKHYRNHRGKHPAPYFDFHAWIFHTRKPTWIASQIHRVSQNRSFKGFSAFSTISFSAFCEPKSLEAVYSDFRLLLRVPSWSPLGRCVIARGARMATKKQWPNERKDCCCSGIYCCPSSCSAIQMCCPWQSFRSWLTHAQDFASTS